MIEDLVEQIEARFAELGAQLTDPEVIGDRERYAEAGRAYSRLEPAAKLAGQWRRAQDDAAGAEELLSEDGEDPEVRELLGGARERIEHLEEEIRLAMVEEDPNDEKSVIVEIQGGAGGDEAGLWAGDLYRMYMVEHKKPPTSPGDFRPYQDANPEAVRAVRREGPGSAMLSTTRLTTAQLPQHAGPIPAISVHAVLNRARISHVDTVA